MIYIYDAFYYVTSDPFFLPALTAVIIIGLFVGATVFNGDIKASYKFTFSLLTYSFLLTLVNLSRVVPLIIDGKVTGTHQPLAGVWTNFFVSLAYIGGMYFGVFITRKAHRGIKI